MERLFATKRITTKEYGKVSGRGDKPRRIVAATGGEDE